MNLKEFLVLKATSVLPPELQQIILERVRNDAAEIIQSRYRYKVKKNVDILGLLMYYSQERNRTSVTQINRVIEYAYDDLTIKYIQDSDIWTKHLDRIMDIYKNEFDFYIFITNYISTNIFFSDKKRHIERYGDNLVIEYVFN